MNPAPSIPIVMYHTVGRPLDDWLWSDLTISDTLFEKQIRLLKAKGYRSLSLDEVHSIQSDGRAGTERHVALTFDDGYLDNWVFAYPILKREGWRGTVYVNPEFIDPGETPRPNLEDVWAGRCGMEDLQVHGFLNRAELRLLNDSGVLEVGSHSMSHTWYPTGPEIVDFHRPGLSTPWLAWNARPDRKFAYLTEDQSGFTPYGHPIHAHGRSLGIRRYLPDPMQLEKTTALVAANGGEMFFADQGWRQTLMEAAAPFAETGRYESDQEMATRLAAEINDARDLLEELLAAPVLHFCWPGGAYRQESWTALEKSDYRTICIARSDHRRWQGDDPRCLRRIGCSDQFTFMGRRFPTSDPTFLLLACEVSLGRDWKKWPLRLRKLGVASAAGFRGV
jgi:Polysaccharide deacetylase